MVLARSPEGKFVVLNGLFLGTELVVERSADLNFSDFCKLTYKRTPSIKNQREYVKKLFESTGANLVYSDEYYQKLFNDGKRLSPDICDQIPNPISRSNVEEFLIQFMDEDFALEKMDQLGIPRKEVVDLGAWVAALADQLQIIVHANEDEPEIIMASYQKYLNSSKEIEERYIQPLHLNDKIWVENTPSEQDYRVSFYKKITHTWVIHNMGTNIWTQRYLKCMDGKDVSIRPSERIIPIPNVKPNGIIKISTVFDARGKENKATSVWKMMDANDQDCFPNDRHALNVVIDVKNLNYSEERK
ncbi:MAG: NBR1-Ig-like domain-containing protein [Parabacteroides sp.]|nr:NBR1-Ig-like domain-containing protein [Parabacteroides sp.]